jgi:hypothetical protein
MDWGHRTPSRARCRESGQVGVAAKRVFGIVAAVRRLPLRPVERASAEVLRTLVTRADSDRLLTAMMGTVLVDAPRPWLAGWRRDAVCANSTLDFFASDRDEQARCLAVCARCPVIEQCRDAARYAPDPWAGVAGGRTGEQRRREDRAAGAGPGWRRPARVADGPRPCACGCERVTVAGEGATHPACRQRARRERQRAA